MPLIHFTDRNLVRLLATETRRTDTTPYDLARAHAALGTFLAGELLEHLVLHASPISHPQGIRAGWRLADEDRIAVVPFLRAGLYVGEGVRELLRISPMIHVSPKRETGLEAGELASLDALNVTTAVLVDSVVNTGASLEPVLAQLSGRGLRTFVLSLVAPVSTAERLAASWPSVVFLFARLSTNQYTGKGATDTGNRLFGTAKETK